MTLANYVHRSPEVRKERAEAEIATTFEALRDGRLVYDDWVRECLSHAIGADMRGLYDLARVDGELARLPDDQRTMRGRRPYAPYTDADRLERAFTLVRTWPVREHPTFG
jgi:hypothetical protein